MKHGVVTEAIDFEELILALSSLCILSNVNMDYLLSFTSRMASSIYLYTTMAITDMLMDQYVVRN